MPWYRVELAASDVAALSAKKLMQEFAEAFRARQMPANVRVYHRVSTAGDHEYYFSPEAFSIAEALLRSWGATACPADPNLTAMRLVDL